MAINIKRIYSTHVGITFYSEGGLTLRCNDCGTMDDIAERVYEILVKHNFVSADICSEETGELLMIVERN